MNTVEEFIGQYGVERKGTNSLKWDDLENKFGNADLLPLWVADMEFKVPEAVQKAMIDRIEHGVFGYTVVPPSYYDAFFAWQKERYDITLKEEWIRFSPGVVSSFFWMVNAFTKVQDSVLILSPVYYPFYDAINETKRKVVTSDLINQGGEYTIDFEDVERKIIEQQVKLFIFCSPHNPVGRVWKKAELTRLFDICLKHNVVIISDEIHQDLLRPAVTQIGALNLDEKYWEKLIVLNAPSKTFNMACLLHSHIVIPNDSLRAEYDEYAKTVNQSAMSVMGLVAAEAAYQEGGPWLEGLLEVVEHNYEILETTFKENGTKIVMSPKEGTYLAWIDMRAYLDPSEVECFIQDKCGLAIDYGEWFGAGCEGFIRINLATQPEHVSFAANALVRELKKL